MPPAFGKNPNIKRLFPDFRETEKDYYKREKIFPIMHLIVIRRELYERHPHVATSLYNAFCESKAQAFKKMRYLGTLRYMLPWLPAELDEISESLEATRGRMGSHPIVQPLRRWFNILRINL